jgi:hypothetical protein
MDINQFDSKGADAGAIMTVINPVDGSDMKTKDGNPVTITLAGVDSERYRKAVRDGANRAIEAQRRGQQRTADEVSAESRRMLVACTLGWSGISDGDKPLEHSAANADMLYQRLPWLAEQASVFIQSRANFMKASAAT